MKQDQTKSIERHLNAFIFNLLKHDRITKQQQHKPTKNFLSKSKGC